MLTPVPDEDVAPEAVREWLTARVYDSLDRVALTLGQLLDVGRARLGREGYERWVEEDLPFGLDTAKRYVAVYRAYAHLPKETLDRLPRAWQAMYALRCIDHPAMRKMLDSGEVGPKTTVVEAKRLARRFRADRYTGPTWTGGSGESAATHQSRADEVAADLITYDPSELSPYMRAALGAWLDGSSEVLLATLD